MSVDRNQPMQTVGGERHADPRARRIAPAVIRRAEDRQDHAPRNGFLACDLGNRHPVAPITQ